MGQLPLDPSKSLQLSPSEDLAAALLQEDADDGREGPLFHNAAIFHFHETYILTWVTLIFVLVTGKQRELVLPFLS